LLILRHPCGQAASLMRGTRDRKFVLVKPGTEMPYDEARTIAFAGRHGIDEGSYRRLVDAAKYAWSWREFNETALGSIADRANARVVVYEDLCVKPMDEARTILAFAGLSWSAQTETFLAHSTSYNRAAGYYAVLRNSVAAADRWRADLAPEDQDAVREVVRGSKLVRYWPDLMR